MLATAETRPAIAAAAPDVVVHDILTLAPALAAELEGVPVATLIPHVYPVGQPGFAAVCVRRPHAPHTRWGACCGARSTGRWRSGLRRGQRRAQRRPPAGWGWGRSTASTAGSARQLCLVGTFPQLEYPRDWPTTCTSSAR